MKKFAFLLALGAFIACGEKPTPEPPVDPPVEDGFIKGADISWASEMEAGGRTFKKKDGTEASLEAVLKDCGFNAVRLRVWVDPFKGWSGKKDVLAAAQKAHAAGLSIMIDFHYSDFFADPSRQKVPKAWQEDEDEGEGEGEGEDTVSLDDMAAHVRAHTKEVLQDLKSAGIPVLWIQIGNETRGGMLYPAGALNYDNTGAEFTGFVKLFNAGYDAAKAIFPKAFVMPHLNNAYATEDNAWWLSSFKAQGGKMDMVALSHYPQYTSKIWQGDSQRTLSPTEVNQYALSCIQQIISTYDVPVVVSEVGVKSFSDQSRAKSLLKEFFDSARNIERCAGVFYWEPETDGSWRPEIYSLPDSLTRYTGTTQSSQWGAYDQGAFNSSGAPTSVLDCFAQ